MDAECVAFAKGVEAVLNYVLKAKDVKSARAVLNEMLEAK
jgi:pentatricopeptide repeat protein